MSVIIETERLLLREIVSGDLDALARIYADPVCMQFYPGTKTAAETRSWFDELAFESYARDGFGLWAVVDRASGAVIGDCGITRQETPTGLEPEIGYHLWREHWGRGFATEAAIGCRAHARDDLGLSRVVSITSPENVPSQRVAARVHDRVEVFEKTSRVTGRVVERWLYVSEF